MCKIETNSGKGSEITSTPLEIERKFLVPSIPENLQEFSHLSIRQGYMNVYKDSQTRLRQAGDRYFIATKKGRGLVREEFERELGAVQFNAFWPSTAGRRVEKERYYVPHDGLMMELDIYKGKLKGLITAEVEFDSIEKSAQFVPPFWFGVDVTEDNSYKNSSLATFGIPQDHS